MFFKKVHICEYTNEKYILHLSLEVVNVGIMIFPTQVIAPETVTSLSMGWYIAFYMPAVSDIFHTTPICPSKILL